MIDRNPTLGTVLALALALPVAGVQAQTPPDPPAAAQPNARPLPIAEARARADAVWRDIVATGFSGAVRIDIGGETVLRAAAGSSNPVTGAPFTTETPFLIGSLTKAFTAAAILKLQDEGRLATTDPVSRFFPEAPPEIGRITLHQLLTHSSGLPPMASPNAEDDEPLSRSEFLQRIFARELDFAPGSELGYSNAGYSLLAAVVEVASGEPYYAYLRSRILDPVDADRTGELAVADLASAVHTYDGRSLVECCLGEGGPYWNLLGNGGLISTLDDFVAWRKAFAAGRIVSPEAVRQASQPYVREPEGPGGEGYGWIIGQSPTRGEVQLAAGGNGHFTTEMRYYPEYDLVTLVTVNGGGRPGEVSGRLVPAIFGEPDQRPEVANPQRKLAEDLVAALQSGDEAERRAFLDSVIGPVFRQRVGLDAITQRFADEHILVRGTVVEQMSQSGVGARIVFRLPNGSTRILRLRYGGGPEGLRLAGFEPMD